MRGESGEVRSSYFEPWYALSESADLELARRVQFDPNGVIPPHSWDRGAFNEVEAIEWRRAQLAELWDELVALRIPYLRPPWSPGNGQLIRHPNWVRREGGTCIDLCVLFASALLPNGLRPLVVVDPCWSEDTGHAVLAVDLSMDAQSTETADLGNGFEEVEKKGFGKVSRWSFESAVRRGRLVLLDVTEASSYFVHGEHAGGRSFEEACAFGNQLFAGLERGRFDDWTDNQMVSVVDVDVTSRMDGFEPARLDESRMPAVSLQVPPGPAWIAYPSRSPILEELVNSISNSAGASSAAWAIIVGDAGVGKSTLAHRAVISSSAVGAWFLTASSEPTLKQSLGRAFAAERGQPLPSEGGVRSEDAAVALGRLHSSQAPWVVVLDNANCVPGSLRSLPQPRADLRQRVVVTTQPQYLDAWRAAYPLATVVELGALGSEDIAALNGVADITWLADVAEGSPLLLGAYAAMAGPAGPGLKAVEDAVGRAGAARGSERLCAVVLDVFGEESDLVAGLRDAAWMPPQGLPARLLGPNVDVLVTARLFSPTLSLADDHEIAYDLHRSLASAVRRSDPDPPRRAAGLLQRAPFISHLDRRGDVETLTQMATVLLEASGRDDIDSLGSTLVTLGDLFELHGRVVKTEPPRRDSQEELHDVAERRADVRLDRLLWARALHGKARAVNQDDKRNGPKKGDEERTQTNARHVKEAIEWMEHAEALRDGDRVLVARSKAMRALLIQKRAKFVRGFEKVALLEESRRELEASRDVRTAAIIERRRGEQVPEEELELDEEIARARFNLAGVYNALAAVEDAAAQRRAELLDRAYEVYENVGEIRRAIYGRQWAHPHIAACDFGMGLVCYQRTWLLELDVETRERELRRAEVFTEASLHARAQIDHEDGTDVTKSLKLLAKISLARLAHDDGKIVDLSTDLRKELGLHLRRIDTP